MEDYEGKNPEDITIVTCRILKKQKERIDKLERKGIVRNFNMSAFLRTKLEEYLKEKEAKKE